MSQLIYNDIKQMINEVSNGSTPTNFLEGTVVQTSPLKIEVDGNTEYFPSSAFIVPEYLTDKVFDMEIKDDVLPWAQEEMLFTGRINMKNHLNPGDNVLLCQTNNGQKVVVIDRIKYVTK